jgi:NAD(P)-dependent dehydrogenase (short-subunit alcohol dehydrogenase family)
MALSKKGGIVKFPQFELTGKVALVTGGSRGLGYGIALAFAQAGANVIVASRSLDDLEKVSEEISSLGRRSLSLPLDIRSPGRIKEGILKAVDTLGRIDILMNNAGRGGRALAEEVEEHLWDDIMDTNLKGMYFCGQAVAKVMIRQGGGKIINMSSVLGRVALRQTSVYSASKAAIIQITRSWALEWAKYKICVNAIAPAFIETELTKPTFSSETFQKEVLEKIPLERYGKVEDITGSAIFLASKASDYITGQTLFIDGGWLTQ